MKNILSLILLTEVFEQQAIPAIPFLCILLVCAPFLSVYGVFHYFFLRKEPRPKYPQEILDEAMLDQVRRGKLAADAPGVADAENRMYFGYYDLQAIDDGID